MTTRKSILSSAMWLALAIVFTTVSCDKDAITPDPVKFYTDSDYAFYFEEQDDKIEFFIDAISDESDDLAGDFPDSDLYRIYVDYNANGVIDSGTDIVFSPFTDGSICVAPLLTATSTSGCAFYDEVTSENAFTKTENSKEEHINFRVTLPKEMLSNGSAIKVIIGVHNAETGWQRFPEDSELFSTAFDIAW